MMSEKLTDLGDSMTVLLPGDVLIFRAGDDWIGKAIAWLTDSDVSHAAVMMENGDMAEMISSGIRVGKVEAREGRSVQVMRMRPEKDMAAVVAATKTYVECGTRYDFPAQAILAGLAVYRRIRPTPRLAAILDLVLQAACVELDKLIQQIVLKNPDKAMVCSQLVYQVYEDCGKEYRLQVENGLFQGTFGPEGPEGTVCLAELAEHVQEMDMMFQDFKKKQLPGQEELAQELYMALVGQEDKAEPVLEEAEFGALPGWCSHYLELLEEFLEKSRSNLPVNALFITPADLAYKTKNLEKAGEMELVRL